MQNYNGVKQRFLACFLKILVKKRKKWRELLADQYMYYMYQLDAQLEIVHHFCYCHCVHAYGWLKHGCHHKPTVCMHAMAKTEMMHYF